MSENTSHDLSCFCCGICCHYRVYIDEEEAETIAADQNIPLESFLEMDNEYEWMGRITRLVRQEKGFCVFLKAKEGLPGKYCSIHHVKPQICHDWVSGWYKGECQRGLARDWQLTVDSEGNLHGSEENLKKFNDFQEKLRSMT